MPTSVKDSFLFVCLSLSLSLSNLLVYLARRISEDFYPEPYCALVSHAPTVCYEESVLELWADQGELRPSTEAALRSLTAQAVLDIVNSSNQSGIFMMEKDFSRLLGDIR